MGRFVLYDHTPVVCLQDAVVISGCDLFFGRCNPGRRHIPKIQERKIMQNMGGSEGGYHSSPSHPLRLRITAWCPPQDAGQILIEVTSLVAIAVSWAQCTSVCSAWRNQPKLRTVPLTKRNHKKSPNISTKSSPLSDAKLSKDCLGHHCSAQDLLSINSSKRHLAPSASPKAPDSQQLSTPARRSAGKLATRDP